MDLATPKVVEVGNGQLHVTHGDDNGLYVEFDVEAVHQPFESEQAGQPIYKEVPYITIMFPGDRTKTVKRPAKLKTDEQGPSDCVRFPKQWAAFENQTGPVHEGTPLSTWTLINKADVRMLKDLGVHTVEALAALSDNNLTFLGARMYRDKAIAWLDQVIDGAVISRMVSENETLRLEVDRLTRDNKELGAGLAALQATVEGMQAAQGKQQRKAA